jgi:soluble lytic murein transglycosylase
MTDFSLMDIMGNFTGGPAVPDDMPNYGTVSTATTQTVTTAPAIPEQSTTYDRMLQAESGNRDYDAQGRPMTSPKGAMFASQVMPSTAAAPGYGVRPAQAQTPEEYNRVGREYFQALVNKFGGDEQKAAAAYNAGPGRIQQNVNQNNGQMNVAQLPRETQGYLQKIGQAVGNMIPSAQASTLPPQPNLPVMKPAVPTQAAPQPAPSNFQGQTDEFGGVDQAIARQAQQPFTGQGLSFGGKTQQQLQQELVQQQQEKQNNEIINSNNQQDISKLAFDPNTPKDTQMAALDKLHNTMAYNESMRRAQRKMAELGANPNPREISRAMNDPSIGDYFKAVAYQAFGWREKAAEIIDRLDPKIVYGTSTFGDKNVVTKVNANTGEVVGAVVDGNWTSDPKILNEIMAEGGVSVSGTAKSFLMPQTLGSPVTKTINGQLVNGQQLYDPVSKKMYVQYGNQKDLNPVGWTSATQNVDQQRTRALQELQIKLVGKTEEEKMAILRPYNQELVKNGYQPVQPTELGIKAPVVQGAPTAAQPQQGAGAPQTAAPQQAAPQAGSMAPGPAQGAGPGGRPTTTQMEAAKVETLGGPKAVAEGQADLVKDATKVLTQLPDSANLISAINKNIKLIDSGKTNIGPVGSVFNPETKANQLPGEKFAGKVLGTEDARNTKTIMDTVRKLAADGLKALGSNPSTPDLLFWTENKPTEDDAPEYVKEWMETRRDDLQRRIQFHKDVIKNKGNVPAGVLADTPAQSGNKTQEEKTVNGVTYVFDGKGWKRK